MSAYSIAQNILFLLIVKEIKLYFTFSKINGLFAAIILEIFSDRDEDAEEATDRIDHEGSSGTG